MHIPGTDHTVYITEPCQECKRAKENNPDPMQWTLIKHVERGEYLALWVSYDNIKSDRFEKQKIMLVRAHIADFLKNRRLDPHFEKDGIVIARFRPTEVGWSDCMKFANTLIQLMPRSKENEDSVYKG